jgi:hypothetical protein
MATDKYGNCEYCGGNRWFHERFPELRDSKYALEVKYRELKLKLARLEGQKEIEEAEKTARHNAKPGKVQRQAAVIRRLEKKLEDLGVPPYAKLPPKPASDEVWIPLDPVTGRIPGSRRMEDHKVSSDK